MLYDLRKPCGNFSQHIYYNINNYTEDIPDDVNYVQVGVVQVNNKRRLDIDALKDSVIYTYRVYLPDAYDFYFLWIVDEVFGTGLALNPSINIETVICKSRLGHIIHNMKPRLIDIKNRIKNVQYQTENSKNINYESLLEELGWEKSEFSKFKIPKEEKPKATRKSRKKVQ